jgi:hypothetical protein
VGRCGTLGHSQHHTMIGDGVRRACAPGHRTKRPEHLQVPLSNPTTNSRWTPSERQDVGTGSRTHAGTSLVALEMGERGRGMDLGALKDLCQRLDELAAILEIMEGEPIHVDLHREAANALYQAHFEIERLRSDNDRHRETSNALGDAPAEIERLRSDAADLQHTKFDGGLSNLPPASGAGATDWFKKFLERRRGHSTGVAAAADKTTRTYFPFRVDIWTDDGGSVLEHLAGVENLIVARGAYRAACERWPHAAITLRKGASIVEDSRRGATP